MLVVIASNPVPIPSTLALEIGTFKGDPLALVPLIAEDWLFEAIPPKPKVLEVPPF